MSWVVVADVMCILIASALAYVFSPGQQDGVPRVLRIVAVLAPVWLALLSAEGAYTSRPISAGRLRVRSLVTASVFAGLIVLGFWNLLGKTSPEPLLAVLVPIGFGLMLAARGMVSLILRGARRRGGCQVRVLVVGEESEVTSLVQSATRASLGWSVVGACVPGTVTAVDARGVTVPVFGTPEEAAALAQTVAADAVVVCPRMLDRESTRT